MPQHDMNVANGAGSTVRADINDALAALVSNNSGGAAPATTFAYQWWADTTNGVLKQRNGANDGWVPRKSLTADLVQTKSANYTVLISDFERVLVATGTWTLSLTAAATMGDGFIVYVRNAGTGIITVDPNSTETIDGATTARMFPGESWMLVCDGAGWVTVGRASGRVLIASATASASATLDFTSKLSTDIVDYELRFVGLIPSDAAGLEVVGSVDNGSTWLTSGYRISANLTTTFPSWSLGDANSTGFFDGTVRFSVTGSYTRAQWHLLSARSADQGIGVATWSLDNTGGYRAGAFNAVRLEPTLGTLTSGVAHLYGIRS